MSIASERPHLTHLDLPCSDSEHDLGASDPYQTSLLFDILHPHLRQLHPDGNYSLAGCSGVYFRQTAEPFDGCIAPGFFYVPGVPRLLRGVLRQSYVIWDEGVPPLLVLDYVDGIGAREQERIRTFERDVLAKYCVLWDQRREVLVAHELVDGRYRRLAANAFRRVSIPEMRLELGAWSGLNFDMPGCWLRAWDDRGELIPTSRESLRESCDRLTRLERELGIDPDQV